LELFDRLPKNFFAVFSRKYKGVYAFALLVLFDCLKLYKSHIKKSDYLAALRSKGSGVFSSFDPRSDAADDGEADEAVSSEGEDDLGQKTNYLLRKLVANGWILVEKNPQDGIEYVYVPSYAIKTLEFLSSLSSDDSVYVPLLHQTFSELSLEEHEQDDYMFRSLLSALKNANELELNTTLLYHSICVAQNELTTVLDPNEALRQHFDLFRDEVGDKIYHPMKTYDSLNLYALPVISILKDWQRNPELVAKLAHQAENDALYKDKKYEVILAQVNQLLQNAIDAFATLSGSFSEIDKVNATYIQAVQKKVAYLSSADKTVDGKLRSILQAFARERKANDETLVSEAGEGLGTFHQGYLNSSSFLPPYSRNEREDFEPLAFENDEGPSDESMRGFLEEQVNKFSGEAVNAYFAEAFGKKKSITSEQMSVRDFDELSLFILGTIRGNDPASPFDQEELAPLTKNGTYELPLYRFDKKEKNNV
jgi:hypothetical protein